MHHNTMNQMRQMTLAELRQIAARPYYSKMNTSERFEIGMAAMLVWHATHEGQGKYAAPVPHPDPHKPITQLPHMRNKGPYNAQ